MSSNSSTNSDHLQAVDDAAMAALVRQVATLTSQLDEMCSKIDATISASSSRSTADSNNQPHLKFDVPRFDGNDTHGWIFKLSQFFTYHQTPNEDRLTIASSYLDGAALAWYQWMYRNGQISSWAQFLEKLEIRFAPTAFEDPRSLPKRLEELTAADRLSCFISGLKPAIHREVVAQQPLTISHTAGLARLQKEKLWDLPRSIQPRPSHQWHSASATKSFPEALPTTISDVDDDSAADADILWPSPHHFRSESPPLSEDPAAQLPLFALSGVPAEDTTRLLGFIGSHPVQVLVDRGCTPNFAHDSLVNVLGLTHNNISPFKVLVGSGQELHCSQLCPNISLEIQKQNFPIDLYRLGLKGADIKGVLWDEHKNDKEYMTDLFIDSLVLGAAKMIRRIVGVAHVEDFDNKMVNHFQLSKFLESFQSKQWDPGKFTHRENFYNLEDKVDCEGVDNDMIIGLIK